MSDTNSGHIYEQEDTLKDKFLIFRLGRESYGIEIRYVTEIVEMQGITEVPELPDYIKGIINLRGKIIPVMDVRTRFKMKEKEYNDRTCIVVVDTDDISIGLIVDTVSEVLTIEEENIVEPPEVTKAGNRYIKGIGKHNNSVRLILDSKRLLSEEDLENIDTIQNTGDE